MSVFLIRDVTKEECPWLDEDLAAETEVHIWTSWTYGCISPSGQAVSMEKGEFPFFEVPTDALGTYHVRELAA